MQSLRKLAALRVETLQNVASLNISERVLVTCFLFGVTFPSKIAVWIRIILPVMPSKQKTPPRRKGNLGGVGRVWNSSLCSLPVALLKQAGGTMAG